MLNAGLVGAAGARRLAVAVPGSVAGSERVAAPDGAGGEAVVPIACGASSEAVTASNPGRETVVSATRGASWEAVTVSQAGSNEVSASGDTTGAKSVTSTCNLASSKATLSTCNGAGSETIPIRRAGAKALVSSTSHTGTTSSSDGSKAIPVLGSETVSITGGFTATTCSAAASVELHADDVLHIGPALAQLLRAVLPGR